MHRRLLSSSSTFRSPLRELPLSIRQILENSITENEPSKPMTVHGWVRSIRRQKALAFVAVNDGTSVQSLQVVTDREASKTLTIGASVACVGSLQASPGPNQPIELQASRIDVIGDCADSYPIQKKVQSADYLRKYLHLRPRTNVGVAVIRLRHEVQKALHEVFQSQEFTYVDAPILTSNDCEGAGEAFRITTDALVQKSTPRSPGSHKSPEFFGKPAYLTVSTQLHLEALASSFSRVYTLSPIFRAEPSMTHRHLAEFSMLEAELTFCEELEDVMSVLERSLKHIMRSIRSSNETAFFHDMQAKYGGHPSEALAQGLDFGESQTETHSTMDLYALLDRVADATSSWPRITYSTAVKELTSHVNKNPKAFKYPVGPGLALQSEHEKWLAGEMYQGPVFVTDFPATLKPFYMRLNSDTYGNMPTVACFDLIVPVVGEVAGGSLREERLEPLLSAMTERKMKLDDMEWYLDLRRFGTAPHGGFGVGFERLISWITGLENVKDCIPFPRTAGKLSL